MVGHEGAFAKAMVKKPGGFGASTAPRFREVRHSSPSSASYSPELSKNFITKKSNANISGGGFGASKASRFDGPRDDCGASPAASNHSPERSKGSVHGRKGAAAPMAAVNPRSMPPKSLAQVESRRRPGTTPQHTATLPTADYFEALAAIEASVSNPPPTQLGMAAPDAAWLARNATAEGVVTLPCGLQYKELARGLAGRAPLLDTPCECTFESYLIDGTLFDSSFARGRTFDFVPSAMCQGWTVAMQLMGEGDRWELYVPSHLAYGDAGLSSEARGQYVPPGAALVFVLTLLKVKGPNRPKLWPPPPGHAAAVRPVPAGPSASMLPPQPPSEPPPPLPSSALETSSPPAAAPLPPAPAAPALAMRSEPPTRETEDPDDWLGRLSGWLGGSWGVQRDGGERGGYDSA